MRCARNTLLDTARLDFARDRYFEDNQTDGIKPRTPTVPFDELPIVTLDTVQSAIDAELPEGVTMSLEEMVRDNGPTAPPESYRGDIGGL